jgi:hypothetical protein
VTNAGQDDGLPTSVLREISHLKSLKHENITKIIHAEVKDNMAQIVYEFHEYNLKEFIKKNNNKVMPLIPQSLKVSTHSIMLLLLLLIFYYTNYYEYTNILYYLITDNLTLICI